MSKDMVIKYMVPPGNGDVLHLEPTVTQQRREKSTHPSTGRMDGGGSGAGPVSDGSAGGHVWNGKSG